MEALLSDVPDSLKDVALIDAKTCAAVGGMSVSSWNGLVRSGAAPQPAIRTNRYTRWRAIDVRTFFHEYPKRVRPEVSQMVLERSLKAVQSRMKTGAAVTS